MSMWIRVILGIGLTLIYAINMKELNSGIIPITLMWLLGMVVIIAI